MLSPNICHPIYVNKICRWEYENELEYYCQNIWRRHWHPTPVLLPGKSHGQRSLVGCSHGVTKSRTRLSDFTFTFHFHALEKEIATHSSVFAWRIPGTEEPGGLLSMRSHRVRHDWSKWLSSSTRQNILYSKIIFEFCLNFLKKEQWPLFRGISRGWIH